MIRAMIPSDGIPLGSLSLAHRQDSETGRCEMMEVQTGSAPVPVWESIYDPPEAARYIRASRNADKVYALDSTKLRRWIRRSLSNPEQTESSGRDLLINFDELISMRVVAALRSVGVKWSEIDATDRWLQARLGLRYPFATEIVWAGQGELFAQWDDQLVSASRYGQLALDLLREHLRPFHGLTFDTDTHMAISWEPMDGIVLEPLIQFGAPCIKGTRIPARTVGGMVKAGDSVEWVAQAFEIDLVSVQAACDWEGRLQVV